MTTQHAKSNGDSPAYPESLVENRHGDMVPASQYAYVGGLTKREAFAMAALQGEIAACAGFNRPPAANVAAFAVECADALLAELAKEQT